MTSLQFFIRLKSAHTDRFFVVSSSEKRSEQFYIGAKVSTHEPIFTPIFCLREKIGQCALGIIVLWPKQARSFCWMILLWLLIGLKLVHSIWFSLQTKSWIKGKIFLSDQMLAQMIRFSIRFFINFFFWGGGHRLFLLVWYMKLTKLLIIIFCY